MQLRWYQSEAVNAAYNHLCNAKGNPVICLPTGAGKSLVIADMVRRAIVDYQGRVLVLAHRKELLTQNAEKIKALTSLDVGIYSAGLESRDCDHDCIVAGIQSVYDKANLFGYRDLILIDEVHLVPISGDGMYRQFVSDAQSINPNVKIVGLTATPYRTGEGSICGRDRLFSKICYEAPIGQLMDEGWLTRITNKPTAYEYDTSGLHIRGGEFVAKEVESLFGDEERTIEAVEDLYAKTQDRRSVMVFCASVKHAEFVAALLKGSLVTGETPEIFRAAILQDFVAGKIKYLVNVDVLCVGFDAPCVDAIAILRATASPGLFAQIVGRGLRRHELKKDCVLLDYGSNLKRHGPIDSIEFGRRSVKEGEGDKLIEKLCPSCEQWVKTIERVCECGFQFPYKQVEHETKADESSQVMSEPEELIVVGHAAGLHAKEGKTPTLRVDYEVKRASDDDVSFHISEWVCLQHEGYAKMKAIQWWRFRSVAPVPNTIEEALTKFAEGWVTCPQSMVARREGKYWKIVSVNVDEVFEPQQSLDELPF